MTADAYRYWTRLRDESGSAFLLMLMVSLGLAVLVTVVWQLLRTDWQVVASHEERWEGRHLAETGIEKGLEKLAEDTGWSGNLDDGFPSGSSQRYYVTITREGDSATIRAYAILESGYQSETVEAQTTLEERWPWEI